MDGLRRSFRRRLERKMAARPDAFDAVALALPAVVFAPHCDDETLGCAGTIARKVAAGAKVQLVFMTDGSRSHPGLDPTALAAVRSREAIRAAAALGIPPRDLVFLAFPDGELARRTPEAEARVRDILDSGPARQLFVPFREDGHPDHGATFTAVVHAASGTGGPFAVFEYPVWAWRHWPWVKLGSPLRELSPWRGSLRLVFGLRFIRVFTCTSHFTPQLEAKFAALAEYPSQIPATEPGQWSLGALNGGEFLDCFRRPFEVFRRTQLGRSR